jgi:hypothetical protein
MEEKVFMFFVCIAFIYLIYIQYGFSKCLFIKNKEPFTPKDVNNIIQPPGSQPIGTFDSEYFKKTNIKTVSNGYTEKMINNLKPSIPSPDNNSNTDNMGNFPNSENGSNELPTKEFEYPNKYKFTVDYPCRPTATGMYTDCGVLSANIGWSADPYKGLNCKLNDTTTPEINNNMNQNREIEYNHSESKNSKQGISGVGTTILR